MFHYTIESVGTVEETIHALGLQLQTEQFGVLWSFNIQDKLKEKGIDFERQYVVLEVCNPAEANRLLSETPMAGYFLPCKIVVYEAEGKVLVGMLKLYWMSCKTAAYEASLRRCPECACSARKYTVYLFDGAVPVPVETVYNNKTAVVMTRITAIRLLLHATAEGLGNPFPPNSELIKVDFADRVATVEIPVGTSESSASICSFTQKRFDRARYAPFN
jgi:uncharacterized protein (DUF302 family)